MINVRWNAVKTAYEPYLAVERVLFIANDYNGRWHTVLTRPNANVAGWIWAFDMDHEHTLIHICIYGFKTLDEAYYAIIAGLFNHPKTLIVSTITEVIDNEKYAEVAVGKDYDYTMPSEIEE